MSNRVASMIISKIDQDVTTGSHIALIRSDLLADVYAITSALLRSSKLRNYVFTAMYLPIHEMEQNTISDLSQSLPRMLQYSVTRERRK